MLNIHLKTANDCDRLVATTRDILRSRGLTGTVYLAGDRDVLESAGRLAPDIDTACLADQGNPGKQIETALRFGCERIQFGRSVAAVDVQRARAAGLVCNLFWSDDVRDAKEYLDIGIQCILTNVAHAFGCF